MQVRSKAHFKEIVNSDLVDLNIIMFTATWCRPCQSCYDQVNRLAKVYRDNVQFALLDVDELEEIVHLCKVKAFPTFMFISRGQQIDFSIGAGMDLVEDKIRYHLKEIRQRVRAEDLKQEKAEDEKAQS